MPPIDTSRVDKAALRRLYTKSTSARAILDHFAARERNWGETPVERLQVNVGNQGTFVSRGEIIEVFKQLEKANCGEFVIGRRGKASRFRWDVGMIEVGQFASGEGVQIEPVSAENGNAPRDPGLLEHSYRLRPDLSITMSLPADLSEVEAGRLAEFVRTLHYQ